MYYPNVGDLVSLTPEGAQRLRLMKRVKRGGLAAVVGAWALPALIPGEAIGIAAAGTAVGVGEAIQATVGAVVGGIFGTMTVDQCLAMKGTVLRLADRLSNNFIDDRPLGQCKKALVRWHWIDQETDEHKYSSSWHQIRHLRPQNTEN